MRRIVIFELNEMLCAVDTLSVSEIIVCQKVTKTPGTPSFVEGIYDLRETVIPVIDLNRRFALGVTPLTGKSKLIVSQLMDKRAGYLVNSVKEITLCEDQAFQAVPPPMKSEENRYLSEILVLNDEIINVIDFSAILSDSELREL